MDRRQKGWWWQAPSEQGKKEATARVPFTCQLSYNPLHSLLHAASPSTYHRRVTVCVFVCLLHWAVCSLCVRSNIIYYLPVTKHHLSVTSTKPSALIYCLNEQASVLTMNISIWWIRRLRFRVTKWLIQATEIMWAGTWLKGQINPSLSDFRGAYFLPPQAKVEPSQRKALDCSRQGGRGRENFHASPPDTQRSQSSENGSGSSMCGYGAE